MAKPKEEEVKKVKREVTQDDLDLSPDLVKKGVKLGDIKLLPPLPEEEEDEEIDEEEPEEEDPEGSDDEDDSDEEDEKEVVDTDNAPISFKIRDNGAPSGFRIRTFSRAEHGKNYKDIAAQFEEANTHKKPADLTNQEEVDDCVNHNRNIKHPIVVEKKS